MATPEDQATPTAPPDPEIAKAALQLAQANARKAEADAIKAERDLRYPAPSSTRPEGKVELGDEAGLIADLLAHSLVEQGAKELAQEIAGPLGTGARVLLVADRELAASDWPYTVVSTHLDAYTAAFDAARAKLEAIPPAEGPAAPEPELDFAETIDALGTQALLGPALAGTSALVGGVADIVGWLRADYSIKARKVAIGETPLLAALAGHLRAAGRTIEVDGFRVLKDSPIITKFADALKTRNALKALSAKVNAEVIAPKTRERDERTAALKEVTSKLAEALKGKVEDSQQDLLTQREGTLRRQISELEGASVIAAGATSDADALLIGFDALATSLTGAPAEGEGYPPLLEAALRERLHHESDGFTHVLYANIEAPGGETITKRWLWSDPKVRYIGGAQLSFMLLDLKENATTAAGTRTLLGSVKFGLNGGLESPVSGNPITRIVLDPPATPSPSGQSPLAAGQQPPPPPAGQQTSAAPVEQQPPPPRQ